MVFKMAALSREDGRPTYNTLSSRPGRNTAGSIMSEKDYRFITGLTVTTMLVLNTYMYMSTTWSISCSHYKHLFPCF